MKWCKMKTICAWLYLSFMWQALKSPIFLPDKILHRRICLTMVLKMHQVVVEIIKINLRSHIYLSKALIDFVFHWNTKCNFIWKCLGRKNISISYVFIRLSCHRNHYDTSRYDLKKKPKNLIDVHKYWKKSTIQKLDQDNILKF